jgi:hypothetical protein
MTQTSKPDRPTTASRPGGLPLSSASAQARRQAAAILEVLAGVLRPAEAAQTLGISLARYYLWERRALLGLLAACEPAPRGPRADQARRIAALERENRRLQRECDRQQALVRAAERALGLSRPGMAKGAKRAEETSAAKGARGRRSRRPTVRALKAARSLRAENEEVTPPTTGDGAPAPAEANA